MIDINTCFGFSPWKKTDASLARLMLSLDRWNIDRALTFSLEGAFYDFREGNRETLEVCVGQDRLIPVATIDLRKVIDCEKEVRTFVKQGFKAVRIFAEQQGWSVEQLPFRNLLKAMDPFKLPLMTSEPPAKLYSITDHLSLPVVFLSLHYYKLYETLAVFRERSNFYAEARQLISSDAIEIYIENLGENRLLFGSGLPFEYAGSPIFRLESAKLAKNVKNRIFSENAANLFQIFSELTRKGICRYEEN